MSNIPQQRHTSQSHSADSWHSVPSPHSHTPSVNSSHHPADPASPAESLVDLNPGIPLLNDVRQTSLDGSVILLTAEKRKCWICLTEEGETTPNGNPVNSSPWSKACACSLDAHESCLITWINQSRRGDPSKSMTCPQCKEPYNLQQRVSYLYNLACYYNKRIDRIAPFIAGFGAISGAYVALTVQGWYSLCTFCGEDLALRLFSDENWTRPSYVIRMLFGLQFIPIWLLASRTRYLDSILPFIPLAFIEQDNVALYPHPTVSLFRIPRYETLPPALTMCVLPWLRIVYNKLWDRIVVPWEKTWEEPAVAGQIAAGGGEPVEENDIVVQIVDDNNGNAQADIGPAAAVNNRPAVQHQQPREDMEDVLLATNLTTLCRKIVGAMLLPDVCSLAGWILGQIPWVRRKIPDRFSRNVIGGIVFLVLKDAASVWYKYSAVRSKRSLRVLDYDGRRKRGRATIQ